MIHHEIFGPRRWPECDGGKVGWPTAVARTRNKPDDRCAHENPSHTAIATKPSSASDIRYTVMLLSLTSSWPGWGPRLPRPCPEPGIAKDETLSGRNKICGMIA